VEDLDGGREIGRPEIRPHHRPEEQLRIRALPQEEVAEALLASGPDQEIDVGRRVSVGLSEAAREIGARVLAGGEAARRLDDRVAGE
jgi:hypothetical protein